MQILCICQGGNCRSVAMAYVLKYEYKHELPYLKEVEYKKPLTLPIWNSQNHKRVQFTKHYTRTFFEMSLVENKFSIKDTYGHIPAKEKGVVWAIWGNGRIDVEFDNFGLVLNLHPAQFNLLNLPLHTIDLEPWESML